MDSRTRAVAGTCPPSQDQQLTERIGECSWLPHDRSEWSILAQNMPSNLESRFLRFLSALPGAESLDELLADPKFDGQRRADYLLFDRRVILELKSLEIDTSHKVESEMDKHRDREDFPLMYGTVDLQSVLKHLPDGREINERIFYKTTRSIEDAVRSAEAQIENTAKLLDLPNSAGLLVLLNEDVPGFTPEVVAHRVATLIRRKGPDGAPRSPLAFAWLILESHVLTEGPTEQTLPMIAVEGPRSRQVAWFKELLTYLEVAWSQFNGIPMFEHADPRAASLQATTRARERAPHSGDQVTRQRLWEHRYNANPYLRTRTDAEVLAHGRRTVERLAPYFMVGGPKASFEQTEELHIAWSDFLCEARFRGLDLREMREA